MYKFCIFLLLFCVATSSYAIANPASVYCSKQHFYRFNLTYQQGISSVCVFPDLSYCEEWQYLRGSCQPHQLYWPDTKIDYQNPYKYCMQLDYKKRLMVVQCQKPYTPSKTGIAIQNSQPPKNYP